MRFAFASSSEITEPIASALSSLDGFVGFISNPDRPTGRNQIISPNSFSKWAQNLGYSPYSYDIKGATISNVIYPSLDPSIFEVKYPNTDIQGRIVNL